MQDKYITVNFKDAALFLNKGKKICDYVNDFSSSKKWLKRNEHELAKETIKYFTVQDKEVFLKDLIRFEQVSNMLHVLCGYRPVPTYRKTFLDRKRIKEIDDIAKNGIYKLSNICYYHANDDNKILPICETILGKKWILNANIQNGLNTLTKDYESFSGDITWHTLYQRYYFSNNLLYNNIIDKFQQWYGNNHFKDDMSLIDLILFLAEEKKLKDEMISFFTENKVATFIHIINRDYKKTNQFNLSSESPNYKNLARRTVISSPIYKMKLSGNMVFKIENENLMERIKKDLQIASFLGDGFAKITSFNDDINMDYLIEYLGFKKIYS